MINSYIIDKVDPIDAGFPVANAAPNPAAIAIELTTVLVVPAALLLEISCVLQSFSEGPVHLLHDL